MAFRVRTQPVQRQASQGKASRLRLPSEFIAINPYGCGIILHMQASNAGEQTERLLQKPILINGECGNPLTCTIKDLHLYNIPNMPEVGLRLGERHSECQDGILYRRQGQIVLLLDSPVHLFGATVLVCHFVCLPRFSKANPGEI